jgi:hypothetical protein
MRGKTVKLCILTAFLLLLSSSHSQETSKAVVCPKHVEVPTYPSVARAAHLHGVVIVKITVGSDGTVLAAEPMTPESPRFLIYTTITLVKKWTFRCVSCQPAESYEKTLKFIYKLEGKPSVQDNTSFLMEIPDEITITARPRECDHCPRPTAE